MAVKSLIETVTVGAGGAASIEFTGIPQDGSDLVLVTSLRQISGSSPNPRFRINSDTGSNYVSIYLIGTGSAASSGSYAGNFTFIGAASGGSDTANTFGNTSATFSNYTSNQNKAVSLDAVSENNATANRMMIIAASYATTSAITSLLMYGDGSNFAQYSTASLYKIKYD